MLATYCSLSSQLYVSIPSWVWILSPAMGRGIESRNRVWNWVAKLQKAEPVFVNVYGVQEPIPMDRFRQRKIVLPLYHWKVARADTDPAYLLYHCYKWPSGSWSSLPMYHCSWWPCGSGSSLPMYHCCKWPVLIRIQLIYVPLLVCIPCTTVVSGPCGSGHSHPKLMEAHEELM